jgi:hypothetical protein
MSEHRDLSECPICALPDERRPLPLLATACLDQRWIPRHLSKMFPNYFDADTTSTFFNNTCKPNNNTCEQFIYLSFKHYRIHTRCTYAKCNYIVRLMCYCLACFGEKVRSHTINGCRNGCPRWCRNGCRNGCPIGCPIGCPNGCRSGCRNGCRNGCRLLNSCLTQCVTCRPAGHTSADYPSLPSLSFVA